MLTLWPMIPRVPYDFLNTAILAAEYATVSLSIVLLVGMVGQISLCQGSLVGMGAFVGALTTRHLGIQFPVTLVVAIAAGIGTAIVLGLVALRVRGLYLAVATLIFAWVADQYLFSQPWLVGSQAGTSIPYEAIGTRGAFPYVDLGNGKVLYYVGLATALGALYLIANISDSRFGRAFAAIRGSEIAAASLGIDVVRFKLLGFGLAGALAGLAGGLTLVAQRTVAPQQFNVTNSLFFLAIAAVGGLRSLGGALASSILFALLVGEVFFRQPQLANYLDIISAVLLTLVLLFFRGGLGAIPARLQPILRVIRARGGLAGVKRGPRISSDVAIASAGSAGHEQDGLIVGSLNLAPDEIRSAPRNARGLVGATAVVAAAKDKPSLGRAVGNSATENHDLAALQRVVFTIEGPAGSLGPSGRRTPELLRAEDVTVQFGGLTAVSQASLSVGSGEIVGLIGPNGAGKTTLFNSILGLNVPTSGSVKLFDRDVTEWDVHQRAALGVGRTFQVLQLFRDLSVYDNLLVATHLQNRSGLLQTLFAGPKARAAERNARERVDAVLQLMNLQDLASRPVAGLPFGSLRLIEVARTLVTGAQLVCFDEPASGLDSAETESLIDWFRLLREIGVTLLVIEHDVSMVTRLCDHIYVLNQGIMIADGTPAEIRQNPAVIASYLGANIEESA